MTVGEMRAVGGRDDATAVHAAGAVLWRPGGSGPGSGEDVEVAVVHRAHHDDWTLPKGKVDAGESRTATAVRELDEETGFTATLGRHLATVRYPVGDRPKVVHFWAARTGAGTFTANAETDELRWLGADPATALLTYDSDRDVLDEFRSCPADLATLLLVRHAKAGKRAHWHGPDDERPLEEAGHAQAEHLADMLERFGVSRLHAASRTRCEQTLAPLARRRGLPVLAEPAFDDEAVGRDPDAARRRLRGIAGGAGVAAVCAQGDGIPELVRGLAAAAGTPGSGATVRSNRRLSDPPARKGSVWVLSFRPGPGGSELVAADYYRDATT